MDGMDGEKEGPGSQVLAAFGSMGVWRYHQNLRASDVHLRVQYSSIQLYMSYLGRPRRMILTITQIIWLWHSFSGTAIYCVALTVYLDVRTSEIAITPDFGQIHFDKIVGLSRHALGNGILGRWLLES